MPGELVFLEPSDKRWLALVTTSCASIFHHPAWINLIAECYGYRPFVLALVDSTGAIQAGAPFVEVNSSLTGRRWVSLPFTDHCAPLFVNIEDFNRLMTHMVKLYQEGAVPKIEVRWKLPQHSTIHTTSEYVLPTVHLCPDLELVARNFKHAHRRNVEVAQDRGVSIEQGCQREHMRKFYELQLQTRRRHGIPAQPWSFFDRLTELLLNQGLGFVLLAYRDRECLAGSIFLNWQQTLTYKYAASDASMHRFCPNNLIASTAIQWGCENGYTLFDTGRTEIANSGLRRFKAGWGTQEVPLEYSYLSAKPPDSSSGRMMRLMQVVIQHSPLWVCEMAGKLLYRHVG